MANAWDMWVADVWADVPAAAGKEAEAGEEGACGRARIYRHSLDIAFRTAGHAALNRAIGRMFGLRVQACFVGWRYLAADGLRSPCPSSLITLASFNWGNLVSATVYFLTSVVRPSARPPTIHQLSFALCTCSCSWGIMLDCRRETRKQLLAHRLTRVSSFLSSSTVATAAA